MQCKMRARFHCCVFRSGTFCWPLISRHLRPMWPPPIGRMRSNGETWIIERNLPKYLVSHTSATEENSSTRKASSSSSSMTGHAQKTGAVLQVMQLSPEVPTVKTRSCCQVCRSGSHFPTTTCQEAPAACRAGKGILSAPH